MLSSRYVGGIVLDNNRVMGVPCMKIQASAYMYAHTSDCVINVTQKGDVGLIIDTEHKSVNNNHM